MFRAHYVDQKNLSLCISLRNFVLRYVPGVGDVNECLAFPNVCNNGRCKNTRGGFDCRCNQVRTVYHQRTNFWRSSPMSEQTVGAVRSGSTVNFAYLVFICQGYALDEYGTNCVNIDECSIMRGVCGNGTCVDTEGSFKCKCNKGFETRPPMTQVGSPLTLVCLRGASLVKSLGD